LETGIVVLHHQVEDDHVRLFGLRDFHGAADPVMGHHYEAFSLEKCLLRAQEVAVVIDE